ncbi:adenylate kinase [Parelusimicrobium proximum]|uniref:adenylate kinase n=1 Tax=Parelusimicrobium proximum TaxID=3228953 RepID=UPI003D16408F
MIIVLIGYPGGGKGTQAVFLKEKYKLRHVSTGDLLRAEIAKDTPFGRRIKSIIDEGNLMPDDVMEKMVRAVLADADGGMILDGYPRTLDQAEDLDKAAAEEKKEITAIINLVLEDDEVIRRLSSRRQCKGCKNILNIAGPDDEAKCWRCGGEIYTRDDDKPEAVKVRLDAFKKQTKPLEDFYKDRKNYKMINADQKREAVFKEITEFIDSVNSK